MSVGVVQGICGSAPLGDSGVELVELEMSVAREPCSKRKFQSHPTVPPGRLIELAFAAVSRE